MKVATASRGEPGNRLPAVARARRYGAAVSGGIHDVRQHDLNAYGQLRLPSGGLSVVIAICASYAALDLAGRVTAARGTVRAVWLGGGASAMGLGIWSMHYIGMLAFSLPVPVPYDWPTVLASLAGGDFRVGGGVVGGQPEKMGCGARCRAAS